MKHFYSLFLLVASCTIARAQVNKGDIVLGGNLGYSEQASGSGDNSTPNPSNSYHNAYINPSVGKAIGNNLVLGIDLQYQHSSSSYNNSGQPANTDEDNDFLAGMFLRRYRPIGNGFYLFGQGEVAFTYSHSHSEDPSSGSTLTSEKANAYGAMLKLYPGIAYALNRHWQIETALPNFFSVNYSHTTNETVYTGSPAQNSTSHSLYLSSSLTGNDQFTVGVRYFIGSF